MMAVSLGSFITDYAAALDNGTAAIFAGAGLSKPAGLADWRTLLKSVADDLDLDIDRETDLISLAQFHVNERRNRGSLNDLLIREFTKDVRLTRNHELIARLPIRTLWTTNYDTLLEDSFKAAHKRPDVKITKENLATTVYHRDVTIYKMHGDISQPNDAVLTRDDYEAYEIKRSLFSIQLKGDLVSKTFLFLGFSFTDPNIDYLLSRIRVLMGENQRTHYCVMRRPEPPSGKGRKRADQEYNAKRLSLRISDLKRYNIQAILVDEYEDITELLEELSRRTSSRNIFVSGSATEFDPFGRPQLETLSRLLGQTIIEQGFNLVSGFGLGVGGLVILGATEALYRTPDAGTGDRTILRPFPQEVPASMSREEFYKRYREEILSNARFAIFLAGNRPDGTGKIINAPGVMQEYEIAKQMRKLIIPIGATGHAAHAIWAEVSKAPAKFYGSVDVKPELTVLGDAKATPERLVQAAIAMIRKLLSEGSSDRTRSSVRGSRAQRPRRPR